MSYLVVKSLHLFFVVAWFAGLFYLPRLYVNLAMSETPAERERLLLMSGKLYRFMTPLAGLALLLGLWLWFGFGISGGWLHAKLLLVVLLVGYHHVCGAQLKRFARGENARGHVFYRWFNEVPVLFLLGIVILVVVKPF